MSSDRTQIGRKAVAQFTLKLRTMRILLALFLTCQLAMDLPPPRWVKKGGSYKTRTCLANTGPAVEAQFLELQKLCNLQHNIDFCLEVLKLPYPVDSPNAGEHLSHQLNILKDVGHSLLNDMKNAQLATGFLSAIEHRIHDYSDDFNLPFVCSNENAYKDPSYIALIPYYSFLQIISDFTGPGPVYDYLDNPEFILHLFDLLISPDKAERTMVRSILSNLLVRHPQQRPLILSRIQELFQVVEEAGLDQVPARMVPSLMELYVEDLERKILEDTNGSEKFITNLFEDGFLQLFNSPNYPLFMAMWNQAFALTLRYLEGKRRSEFQNQLVPKIFGYLQDNTFTKEISCYQKEAAQAQFWVFSTIMPILNIGHLNGILQKAINMVRKNHREVISDVFIKTICSLLPIYKSEKFMKRFPSKEDYFLFIYTLLGQMYTWLLDAHNIKKSSQLVFLIAFYNDSIPFYTEFTTYFQSLDDKELRENILIDLQARIEELLAHDDFAKTCHSKRKNHIMEEANKRLAESTYVQRKSSNGDQKHLEKK